MDDRGGVPDRRVAHLCASLTVGDAPTGATLVDAVAAHHEHVQSRAPGRRSLAMPLAAFNASRFDVALVASPVGRGHGGDRRRTGDRPRGPAHGLLAEHGPSMFVPSPDGGFALAGGGGVNPSSMLLAAAMMLSTASMLRPPARRLPARCRQRSSTARRRPTC